MWEQKLERIEQFLNEVMDSTEYNRVKLKALKDEVKILKEIIERKKYVKRPDAGNSEP